MKKEILGIDFNDLGTVLAFYGREKSVRIPTAVCWNKTSGSFCIGQEAYESLLDGNGIVTDKLLSFAENDGITTIEGTKYSCDDLLKEFFSLSVDLAISSAEAGFPDEIVIAIPQIHPVLVKRIIGCFLKLGYLSSAVHVISRSESFIYYIMSQTKEIRTNYVGLFSLENNSLTYYEMKVSQKVKNTLVYAEHEDMQEAFNLEILNTDSGKKLADKILTSCAQRVLNGKIFSGLILTGKGFENLDWADEFMHYICGRKKIFVDDEAFARGAGYRGVDLISDNPAFNFLCICDGRLDSSVFIDINKNDRVMAYPIAGIGDTWYDVNRTFALIPFDTDYLELIIIPMDSRKRRTVKIPLDFLPARPSKTTKIRLEVSFLDSMTLTVDISDAGFGDIYPASDAHVHHEVRLWD